MQNAADSAALAAAQELLKGSSVSTVKATARTWAGNNGVPAADVTVNVPPTTGPHTGDPKYVEVIVRTNALKSFSGIFSASALTVRARAVAGVSGGAASFSMLVLDPAAQRAMNKSGSGNIQVQSSIHVNSSDAAEAMRMTGSGNIEAGSITVVGGFEKSGSSGNVTPWPTTGGTVVADPLASVPAPDLSALTVRSTSLLHISGSSNVTIDPGVYIGGIKVSMSGNVTMNPGIYVMKGGGFDYNSSGNVTGNGVLIYNTCDTGDCSLGGAGGEFKHTGSGNLSLTPMPLGPYRNLLIFQDRALGARLHIAGSGNLEGHGTIYAATGFYDQSGSGNNTMQLIVGTFEKSGSGNLELYYDDDLFFAAPKLKLVE